MNDRRPRRLAAVAALFVSGVALLATTPGPPTARAAQSGELYVAPDEPAAVEVRFTVADPALDEIQRIRLERSVGAGRDGHVALLVAAAVEGGRAAHDRGFGPELDPDECASGCAVIATIDATWVGRPEPGLRVAWQLALVVEYGNRAPEDAVTARVVRGGEAAPPRLLWLGLGALMALVTGAGLWHVRPRFAIPRLILAAGLLVLAAWPWAMAVPWVPRWLEGRSLIGWEELALLGVSLALGIAVAVGIGRTLGGRPTLRRTVGWMAAPVLGYTWWALAVNLGSYRPHEMVALTAALGVALAGAVTAVPPRSAPGRREPSLGVGTIVVLAIQGLLLLPVLLLAAGGVVALAAESITGRVPDPTSLGLGLLAVVVAAFFVIGLRDWRGGSARTLMVIDAFIAMVFVVGGIVVLVQPEQGLIGVGMELRVLVVLVVLVVLGGAIGLGLVEAGSAARSHGSRTKTTAFNPPAVPDSSHETSAANGHCSRPSPMRYACATGSRVFAAVNPMPTATTEATRTRRLGVHRPPIDELPTSQAAWRTRGARTSPATSESLPVSVPGHAPLSQWSLRTRRTRAPRAIG